MNMSPKHRNLLMLHEGRRLKPYRCTAGKLTIGYGRNLDDKGITPLEAQMLLNDDIEEVEKLLEKNLPFLEKMDQVRQGVLINMAFNLGIGNLLEFVNFIKFLKNRDYESASMAMLDSNWAYQVPNRAKQLSDILRTGIF